MSNIAPLDISPLDISMRGEFPLAVLGKGDLAAYIRTHKSEINDALAIAGTVLFRGFDVPAAHDFDAAVSAYDAPGFAYEGSLSNAVRVNITPRVFTANEAPPDVSIYLHHEMAQTPIYPSKLFFYCEIAPGSGGATPLCRSDWVLDALAEKRPELVAAFKAKGVRYSHTMPGAPDAQSGQGRSWRDTLGADTREAAEARLSELGYIWEWQGENLRVTSPVLSAIRKLEDGRQVFFNQLIAAFRGWKDARNAPSKSITFGDGAIIDPADMAVAIEIADELSFDQNWQAGDVALIDNFIVMHGRRPFTGRRRVLASLVA